jgi:hypothetical protein
LTEKVFDLVDFISYNAQIGLVKEVWILAWAEARRRKGMAECPYCKTEYPGKEKGKKCRKVVRIKCQCRTCGHREEFERGGIPTKLACGHSSVQVRMVYCGGIIK